jgi:hypothetical protein
MAAYLDPKEAVPVDGAEDDFLAAELQAKVVEWRAAASSKATHSRSGAPLPLAIAV